MSLPPFRNFTSHKEFIDYMREREWLYPTTENINEVQYPYEAAVYWYNIELPFSKTKRRLRFSYGRWQATFCYPFNERTFNILLNRLYLRARGLKPTDSDDSEASKLQAEEDRKLLRRGLLYGNGV